MNNHDGAAHSVRTVEVEIAKDLFFLSGHGGEDIHPEMTGGSWTLDPGELQIADEEGVGSCLFR